MANELERCPLCPDGGRPEIFDGRYSEDGKGDRPFGVMCKKCGVLISRMPEYGEGNYWWLHTTEGKAHMREAVTDIWNTRYKRTCKPTIIERHIKVEDEELSFWQAICDCGNIVGEDGTSNLSEFRKNNLDKFCSECGAEVVDG